MWFYGSWILKILFKILLRRNKQASLIAQLVKNPSAMRETCIGFIPGSGRSPGEGIGYPFQCSWASLVAQLVKNLPAMQETWVRSLCWEDPLEKGKATRSVFWPGEFHGQSMRSQSMRSQSMRSQRRTLTEQLPLSSSDILTSSSKTRTERLHLDLATWRSLMTQSFTEV